VGALAILALNRAGNRARGTVRPRSATWTTLLITIAFLVGSGRSAQRWRARAALVSGACLLGVLLNAEVIIDFRLVADRVSGPQPHQGTRRPCWLSGALCVLMAAFAGSASGCAGCCRAACIAASMIYGRGLSPLGPALGLRSLALLAGALC